jgi:hypothetical protein
VTKLPSAPVLHHSTQVEVSLRNSIVNFVAFNYLMLQELRALILSALLI